MLLVSWIRVVVDAGCCADGFVDTGVVVVVDVGVVHVVGYVDVVVRVVFVVEGFDVGVGVVVFVCCLCCCCWCLL